LLAQIRQLAASRWRAAGAPVLAISARAAQSQPHAEGWAEFCQALHDLVRESAITGVRRLNALGTAARVGNLFAAVRDETAADLTALPSDAAVGLDALGERCAADVADRLKLRRADVSALLWSEAAKRWDGPGGWALRTGGLTSLGLGAGAAIAARNPLLALGTAAGALAADQVQRALRDHRMSDGGALVATRRVRRLVWRRPVAGARARSALAGDPAALGVPTRRRRAAARRGRSMKPDEIGRSRPSRCGRAQLAALLPCFARSAGIRALAAWVMYQVAAGFWSGTYAGFDFLLSAALLLLAYLFAVRFGVRRGLGLRARGLLNDVILRTRQALGSQADATREAVRHAVSQHRSALDHLAQLEAEWRAELTRN
jgi:hypothetical protein